MNFQLSRDLSFDSANCWQTDWLASEPVFYDQSTNTASLHFNEVLLKKKKFDLHSEGLYNFFDFGYSVFGQTPVKDIKFLPPSNRLIKDQQGRLHVEKKNDPIHHWCSYRLCEEDIIELIRERVQKWESSLPADQEIVLPLSGGFDSRLLLWSIRDKSRVRAFTYGISDHQIFHLDNLR